MIAITNLNYPVSPLSKMQYNAEAMISKKFTPEDVAHIAVLANIPITDEEKKKLADGFNTTIGVVDKLFLIDVEGIEPTHQVTGLENVMREDEVDTASQFTQNQALMNARRSYNGFFVISRIIDQDA